MNHLVYMNDLKHIYQEQKETRNSQRKDQNLQSEHRSGMLVMNNVKRETKKELISLTRKSPGRSKRSKRTSRCVFWKKKEMKKVSKEYCK